MFSAPLLVCASALFTGSSPAPALHASARSVAAEAPTGQTDDCLETGWPASPPPRSIEYGGYQAPADRVTWAPFTYATPTERRWHVRQHMEQKLAGLPQLPPLQIVLIGGPSSGKGTIAPMISQAFRVRAVSVGQLLRGEQRSANPRGLQAAHAMQRGELLPDELVLELLHDRLYGCSDTAKNGWLLDGFPRTAEQAYAILSEPGLAALRPDCVVLLDRPTELIMEFALGRCTDTTTGQTYHPIYAPPPDDVRDRLVWRIDDTTEVLARRIADFRASSEDIVAAFDAYGVPVLRVSNARSELVSFEQIADWLADVAMTKLSRLSDELLNDLRLQDLRAGPGAGAYGGAAYQSGQLISKGQMVGRAAEGLAAGVSDDRESDVEVFCDPNEQEDACLVRYADTEPMWLLAAVQRCNSYDPAEYIPVLVGDEQVGWVNADVLDALMPQLAIGHTCELVQFTSSPNSMDQYAGEGRAAKTVIQLAPGATSLRERTALVAALVEEVVADGLIPAAKVRHELQDVRPFSQKYVGAGGEAPLLRMERAAMIYFGIPSYGVHVNGFVRDPATRRVYYWVAKRSLSKPTYPGLLDQMVAGGQPSGLSFRDNVVKECQEEASLPPELIDEIRSVGLVSYRYTTQKGLSTKILATYDVELPSGLLPICADGEVDEFQLMPVEALLSSLREELPLWKPNSALVAVDFSLRHGFIETDEPGYIELSHMLRAGGIV